LLTQKIHCMILLVAVILLSACSRGHKSTEVGTPISPLQLSSATSPVATAVPEQESVSAIADIPEPESGKGTVVGIIYDRKRGEPYALQFIYLAEVIEMEHQGGGDPMLFAELDVQSDRFDQTDENGRFVVENVEPGLYALAVRLPNLKETLLYDADTTRNLSVKIEAGKISDMGNLEIMGPR
jgi:hypothetical protein